jgi:glycerol kinase
MNPGRIMRGNVLLVDFGASRIKSGIWNGNERRVSSIRSIPSVEPVARPGGFVEVDPGRLLDAFNEVARDRLERGGTRFSTIMISCEMHGYIVVDPLLRPVTRYISWRDERALHSGVYDETGRLLKSRYRKITGTRLRPCWPFVSIIHLLEKEGLGRRLASKEGPYRIFTLADWLASGGKRMPLSSHVTMSAGLGFWDQKKRNHSVPLQDFMRDIEVSKNNLYS